ncbi:MAG: DinB family protein [Saprospiraceae bacterium]|nr:DinB family protein [Saprospiraceae bacterium]
MKTYLFDTFRFNDQANRQMLAKIKTLPEPEACVRYFSHLINSQNKWLARIEQRPGYADMSWWEPVYALADLEAEWAASLDAWLHFLDPLPATALDAYVPFTGYDGAVWEARIVDIALQLNYHSIHHRAQMQPFIRAQGLEPDFIDYIGTRYRRVG